MYQAWFINMWGESFSKVFDSFEEMNEFIERAYEVKTRLTGFVSF